MRSHPLTPNTRLKHPDDIYVRCARCTKTFIGRAGDRFCPLLCRGIVREFEMRTEWNKPKCPNCGIKHWGEYGRLYCSTKCSDAYRAKDAMEMVEAFRKELNLGASTGYLHALYRYLVDRDGDECYLCGKRVRLDVKGARGPSVDHLIPRSLGGKHELANAALVHKNCNSRKGNRAANEQLRLLG